MPSSDLKTNKRNDTNPPPALWKSIILIILFTFVVVLLFGLIIFFLVSGAEEMGVSRVGYIAILVIVSGVFAWLVKRMSDAVSDLSSHWFSEESDEPD